MTRCVVPAVVFVAVLAAALLGPHERDRTAVCEAAPAPARPSPPPLLTIRTRDHELAIYGGDTLGFTVLDDDGMVLAERIDEGTFAARFPGLHRQLGSMLADDRRLPTTQRRLDAATRERPWLDATGLPRRHGIAAEVP